MLNHNILAKMMRFSMTKLFDLGLLCNQLLTETFCRSVSSVNVMNGPELGKHSIPNPDRSFTKPC